ncbi:MAG: hypothetical protein JSW65_05945 [Candidatus Bipolaricaulota bacterium]|nr:MAG: hypothetical protein JSW65_05945 [Candidatus Bipolaricaulota bacterium]
MERRKKQLLDGIAAALPVPLAEVDQPTEGGVTAVLVMTGDVEREVLKLVSRLPAPTLLVAHAEFDSLPAALEALARVRQDGGDGRILFGTPEQIALELGREARIADSWQRLRFSRVGVIGEGGAGPVASDVDRAFLKGRLGIEIIQIPKEELLRRAEAAVPKRSDVSRFLERARGKSDASGEAVERGVAIYEALRSLVDEHRLAACSLRCTDLGAEPGATGCYALSRLNDEEIPTSCEGDMQSLFSLVIARLLGGGAAFMGNIASVDTERNEVLVAHSSCPLSIAREYAVGTHDECRDGIGIQAFLAAGPCTLFRLGGERLDHLFLREGVVGDARPRDDRCRTEILVVSTSPLGDLLVAPLGNHHVVLPGHHGDTLRRFFNRYLHS